MALDKPVPFIKLETNDLINNNFQPISVFNLTDESSILYRLSQFQRYIAVSILALSLIICLSAKSIIFKYFYKNGIDTKNRPINGLIFIDQVVTTFGPAFTIANQCIMVLFPKLIADIFGNEYCIFQQNLCLYWLCFYTTGSFVISLYRVLYLECQIWVKFQCGEQNLLMLLALSNLAGTALLVIAIVKGNDGVNLIYNDCMGISSVFRRVLSLYNEFPSSYFHTGLVMLFGTTLNMMELGIFLKVFIDRALNTNVHSREILTIDTRRRRNKANAVTMIGQMYCFCAKFAWMLLSGHYLRLCSLVHGKIGVFCLYTFLKHQRG